MVQTVIGLFQTKDQAESAIEKLNSIGIDTGDIHSSSGLSLSDDSYEESEADDEGYNNSPTGSGSTGYKSPKEGNYDYTQPNAKTNYSSSSSPRTDNETQADTNESGIARFFRKLFGGDEENVNRYSTLADKGTYAVTVRAANGEQAEQIVDLLDDCGAINVEEKNSQFDEYSDTGNDRMETDDEIVIPKVQENLEVGKTTVESGRVRVRSRIVEMPVEENIQLWEERVKVERKAVDRPLSQGERADFKDQDIEMIERSEVPVVSKEARVVEEIKISKNNTQRTETIKDTLRNTEVDIDNQKNPNRPNRND